MKTYKLNTHYKQILADTITPVSVYLKIRDKFPNSILLESSDYHGNENSFSYICFNPIGSIKVEDQKIETNFPDGFSEIIPIDKNVNVANEIQQFSTQFIVDENNFKFINQGLFGYIAYDAIQYFETIKIAQKSTENKIPEIYYAVYQNIIAINHFKNEAYIFCHSYENNNNIEEIHPIAGTFKRTGNDEDDAILAKKLNEDKKENSEHVMLVDLARNDLSRSCNEVKVEKYKEVQFFSHVIHLVSKVIGKLKPNHPFMELVAKTFPAGTLSGAPKHKAMQLIESIEKTNRSFYGGAIGFMDFEGNFNHAIMIRSFLSKNHTLHFQAGAGIVADSSEENETQEVYNKLGALQKALDLAENI